MKNAVAVLGGLLLAGGVIAGIHVPLARQRAELEARLREKDLALDRLRAVRVQVDAYQRERSRRDQQVDWIGRERDSERCPWPLPGLDLERLAGVSVDGIVVGGTSLVLSGTSSSPAVVDELAGTIRTLPWARSVEGGAAGAGRSSFGLFARIELPRCHPARAGAQP